MAPTFRVSPSAVRAVRNCLVLGTALAAAVSASGCGHRRTAMRPVYGTPVQAAPVIGVPAAVAAPEADCPTPGATGIAAPTMTTVPSGSDPFASPAVVAPSVAAPGYGVERAGGSPPAPDVDPPSLDAPEIPPPATLKSSARRPGSISSAQPRAWRGPARATSTAAPARSRVALRDAVRPFADGADDLFQPPKADRPWRYVVLHHSGAEEGGLDRIDRDHRNLMGYAGCGYHFVIGNGTGSPDGRIEMSDRWLDQKNGVHCRNGKASDVNEYGIGICLVGNFDRAEPTPKQLAAARALVAYLGDRYAIPADRIGTHGTFADGPTACPGKYFPVDAITAPAGRLTLR